jgi:transcriptional regulator with XRE-family HTH domain
MNDVTTLPDTWETVVGEWVRDRRERMGLNQREFAFQVLKGEVGPREVSRIESGLRRLTVQELADMVLSGACTESEIPWKAVAKGLYVPNMILDLATLG